jgi:hypothetical protein
LLSFFANVFCGANLQHSPYLLQSQANLFERF